MGTLAVLASRISYVGDLGWELYVPIEQGAALWDMVAEAGEPHGIIAAGIGVYGTTGRLEKCYRAYGFELDGDHTVVEAGMSGAKLKDEPLRRARGTRAPPRAGARRDPLHADRRRPPVVRRRASATCSATSRSSHVEGGALVDRLGRRSFVTSAGAGPSIGKHILMSYLPPAHANVGEELAVEYMGERYPCTVEIVGATPIFDPENTRIRS